MLYSAGIPGPHYPGDWNIDPESISGSERIAEYGQQLFAQSFEEWDTIARTNFTSIFFVTTAFLGLLAKSAEGQEGRTASVINITSDFGHTRLNWGYASIIIIDLLEKLLIL